MHFLGLSGGWQPFVVAAVSLLMCRLLCITESGHFFRSAAILQRLFAVGKTFQERSLHGLITGISSDARFQRVRDVSIP